MALSFKPGDVYQLDPNQGAWLHNAEFPPGVYIIWAYGARGGNGRWGALGGKGGYVYIKLTIYEEKRFRFTIGIMGGIDSIQKGGGVISPQAGIPKNLYSYGGNGGYDIADKEYGGGGGGYTSMSIYHKPNYTSGNVMFTVGGGGGGNGHTASSNANGEPGGVHYDISSSYYKINGNWSTTATRGQDGRTTDEICKGEGGGGAGAPGGGIKDAYFDAANPDLPIGGGGFGGRTYVRNSTGNGYQISDAYYVAGLNDGHGYIRIKYQDYIWYYVRTSQCKELETTKVREDFWVTVEADIEYEQYNDQGILYRCNTKFGIFKNITYTNVKNQTISADGTFIKFQMTRNDAYIYANFVKYTINCTSCSWSSDNKDKVILPGNTYRVRAGASYRGKPFRSFLFIGLNIIADNVQFVSRNEFTFVMPEKDVTIIAMFFERFNSDIYKNECAQEPFDYDLLPFKE